MIILGIDPGYAIVGCGIIDYTANKFKVLNHEAVTTPAGMPFEHRIEFIYDSLDVMIKQYKPDAIAIEELFFHTNHKTVIGVAQARGVTLLAAVKNKVPFFEYTPLQVKQSVVGYGRAVKPQVMEMTRILLGMSSVPKPDDVADALAIAICHAHNSGSALSRLKLS